MDPQSFAERDTLRAQACDRLTELFHACRPLQRGDLMRFHARAKMLLLACSPAAAREMGHLLASAAVPVDELACRYTSLYLATLWRVPTRGAHVNALQHLAGHLRAIAAVDERRDLEELITRYRVGEVSRLVPLGLLRAIARRHGLTYVLEQHYLDHYPEEQA
jgi:uncharacterized protein YbgA (DUF1722 family)